MLAVLLVLLLPTYTLSKTVVLTVRENFTQSCPNVKSDIIDRSSVKFTFDMISNEDDENDDEESSSDQVILTDVNGKSRSITFPGCYRVKLSFKMNRPIENPYIEAFLQLGQNIPCRAEGRTAVSSICTNITKTNWCPQSANNQLRNMLTNKQTCQFCHICDTIKEEVNRETSEWKEYVFNEGSEKCDATQGRQTLRFKMCAPSRREVNEKHGDARDKLQEYWNYLKQGILTAVVHVMDRSELDNSKRQQCHKMCSTYSNKRGISSSYRNTLLKSIESLCTPKDTYAACVYHTVKFDINGDF
ncbi:hypothetical protein RB195_001672 [Necator americanus]|uniref:Uncharacterized protein n=1 Tax=Necator americanus TaxID=51031 RepID=A0ABR1DG08_NECAM